VGADVKEVLYNTLDEIGKEKIRIEVINEIGISESRCNEIIEECKRKMGTELNDESLVNLCEALIHFLLTASMLPSDRKINWKGAELDLVIPSLKMLNKSPDKTLVIQMIKGESEVRKLGYAKSVQPFDDNIWMVSAKHIDTNYKNYYVGSRSFPFSRILLDINTFLVHKGDRGLKLLHGE
jgi:hypothetical protein